MNDFFHYLLKVNVTFTILFLLYEVLFKNNTFHSVNRSFLLSTIVLSIILPLITINFNYLNIAFESPNILMIDNHTIVDHEVAITKNDFNISFLDINNTLCCIYALGIIFIISKLLLNVRYLVNTKKTSLKKIDGKYLLIYTMIPSYFSFFNWIYIPIEKKDSNNSSIINHEKLHGRKKHTIDLLITEIFKALIWFNPFVYFFQKKLKVVHEYQIDKAVLKNESLTSYLQTILDNLPYQNNVKIYNYFGELPIKKRINMITKNKTSKWSLIRYNILIPIVAILLMSFNYKNPSENIPSILPIKKGSFIKIASTFGMRHHPILKTKRMHNGVDFAAKIGTEIRATADGIVTFANKNKGYGNMIVIKHNTTFETLYSQMKEFTVKKGDKVKKGQVIGYVGISGNSSGPHLHYEVKKDNKNVNPALYFVNE